MWSSIVVYKHKAPPLLREQLRELWAASQRIGSGQQEGGNNWQIAHETGGRWRIQHAHEVNRSYSTVVLPYQTRHALMTDTKCITTIRSTENFGLGFGVGHRLGCIKTRCGRSFRYIQ